MSSINGEISVGWGTYILAFLGLCVLLSVVYDVIFIILEHFSCTKKNFVEKYGKWAVITGCTNGIGKSYAEELAKCGMNIALVSRNIDKLTQVSTELEERYGVETEVIQVDFTNGRSIYKKVADCLEGKEIGILVNNVGIMSGMPIWFRDNSEDEIWDGINVNVASVPAMTKIVLPSMIKRRKGCIVNISSLAADSNLSTGAIYCGTKAFVDAFSQSLRSDISKYGIEVQTITPGFVATDMLGFSSTVGKPCIVSPSSSQYVKKAVGTIGLSKRTAGYWPHSLTKIFFDCSLTKWIAVRIVNIIWENLLLEKEQHAAIQNS